MSKFILKGDHFCQMIPTLLEPGRMDYAFKDGFGEPKMHKTFRLELQPVHGQYKPSDCENPMPLTQERPSVMIYGAVNFNGGKRVKAGEFRIASERGSDYCRWSEFGKMLAAMNVDPSVKGIPQGKAGQPLRAIWIKVGSIPGGNYDAKNYIKQWSLDGENFKAEKRAADAALIAAMEATEATQNEMEGAAEFDPGHAPNVDSFEESIATTKEDEPGDKAKKDKKDKK